MDLNKWQEPNCDMDLDVYKDYIYEFNNNDDLMEINLASVTQSDSYYYCYHFIHYANTYNATTDGVGISCYFDEEWMFDTLIYFGVGTDCFNNPSGDCLLTGLRGVGSGN